MILKRFCVYYTDGSAISFCLPCVKGGGAACRLGGIVKYYNNYKTTPQSLRDSSPYTGEPISALILLTAVHRSPSPLSLRDISPHRGESPFTQGRLFCNRIEKIPDKKIGSCRALKVRQYDSFPRHSNRANGQRIVTMISWVLPSPATGIVLPLTALPSTVISATPFILPFGFLTVIL